MGKEKGNSGISRAVPGQEGLLGAVLGAGAVRAPVSAVWGTQTRLFPQLYVFRLVNTFIAFFFVCSPFTVIFIY